jgi:hypothetical protein
MDEQMAAAVHKQAMENWIHPEILKRHKEGIIKELPIVLRQAQVLFGLDGSKLVRINDEVRGTFKAKLKKAVKKGDYLRYDDVEGLYFAEQSPDDKDFGHITLVSLSGDKLTVSFSFEYGAHKVQDYLKLGTEFLKQANSAMDTSTRVCVALAMTATENIAKARLAASPLASINTKQHTQLISAFSKFSSQDSPKKLNAKYTQAYKFFHRHFNGVRYQPSYPDVDKAELKKNLKILKDLQNETTLLIANIDSTQLAQRQVKVPIENFKK